MQTTKNFCEKNKLCTINTSLHVLPWLSCQDLAMILASIPCIMISHDLGKGTMVNHDLARLTMIMASVPWLRTLGNVMPLKKIKRNGIQTEQKIGSCGSLISAEHFFS